MDRRVRSAPVAFVSVTQQFNTTDSMGRLMLNVLLSFAQFEREIAAERIRDKFAASKRKGLWMHGIPPLGYDVVDRRLVPNPTEAPWVRRIFQRFVELRSAVGLINELKTAGVTTKAWTSKNGRARPVRAIGKSYIYAILTNRTYLGELRHRDQWITGAHEPIISTEIWEQGRSALAVPSRTRGNESRAKVAFALKGLLWAPDGSALTPWHTRKPNGRQYRYYVSTRAIHWGANAAELVRLPAGDIEKLVEAQALVVLQTPGLVADVVAAATSVKPALDEAQVTVAMTQVGTVWESLFPGERQRLLRLLVRKVVVYPDRLDIDFHPLGLAELADVPAPSHAEAA
ncbi:recombinase family protein [Tahibacter amnicola]|uniref:Recombinase family protein n=1 Tax=Tahibacter amnicola TaxID=2976241 RepID=A0ABY6BQD2_9GAMM|nr:recombinase family protein [Tahibacter amnicola]UXI70630.1 recombinase family protein [Tahibacter amnicola]